MCKIHVSSACVSDNTDSQQESLYIIGNTNFLFDPLSLFSSNNLEEAVAIAQRLKESGYRKDIYIFPATNNLKALCKEEIKKGIFSTPIPYAITVSEWADIHSPQEEEK